LAKQSRYIMYNKSHLVGFGNFLLKTYDVQVHSTDGKNQPIHKREVSDADMANWKEEEKPDTLTLPSHHQIGDSVVVYFGTSGVIKNCKVIKVHFTESKVFYDVEVKWKHAEYADKISAGVDKGRELTDRLYNLDSAVVFSPDDFEKAENIQKESNFNVRLKAYVEKKMKESGMLDKIQGIMPYDDREDMFRRFRDSLGDGAVDYLKVRACVEKYIPQQS
jgi:hypothetical protein